MPTVYKYKVSARLRDILDNFIHPDEALRLKLWDEFALVKQAANEVVALYSAASDHLAKLEASNGDKDKIELAKNAVLSASSLMMDSLHRVADFAMKIERVENSSKASFSASTIDAVLNQVNLIMYDVCGVEHQDLAEKFANKIESEIVVQSNDNLFKGTTLRPDDDATRMDSTIPLLTNFEE